MEQQWPQYTSKDDLPHEFATFFEQEILIIREKFINTSHFEVAGISLLLDVGLTHFTTLEKH